jgi:hypothetical protein
MKMVEEWILNANGAAGRLADPSAQNGIPDDLWPEEGLHWRPSRPSAWTHVWRVISRFWMPVLYVVSGCFWIHLLLGIWDLYPVGLVNFADGVITLLRGG